jgi:uncharacterized protein (TIGR02266 family)
MTSPDEGENILAVQRKVLLADDVNLFIALGKSFLQREEVEILVAENGKQAYDLIDLHRPDLAFLDLYMPEMDGDQCCRLVKSNPELCNIPIVMVTSADQELEQQKCHSAGCDGIVFKPLQRQTFIDTARKFLNVPERKEPRSSVRMEVLHGQQELFTDFSVNLSAGGLFLETQKPLAPGEKLELKFFLPGQDKATCCQGRVAWVNYPDSPRDPVLPPGMGVEFVDPENLHELRKFLDENSLES